MAADDTTSAEPVSFKTLRPPGLRKFVVGSAQNALILALLSLLARRGGPRWPLRAMTGFFAVMMPVSIVFNLVLWRSGPHRGRADPREEIQIPEHFLGTFLSPEDDPDHEAFVSRLRSELGLSLADTALALATIGDHNRKVAASRSTGPA